MSMRVVRVAELATSGGKSGMLPVSPATIWRWVREGKFPKPFKLGDAVTVWDAAEVEKFIASRSGAIQTVNGNREA
ncbi:MAG: AlpA family phage regulatory protein [Proteobacteria bacterium]|nr:AlpA family phage regulatory protein [Pseudomonadota bacterium]